MSLSEMEQDDDQSEASGFDESNLHGPLVKTAKAYQADLVYAEAGYTGFFLELLSTAFNCDKTKGLVKGYDTFYLEGELDNALPATAAFLESGLPRVEIETIMERLNSAGWETYFKSCVFLDGLEKESQFNVDRPVDIIKTHATRSLHYSAQGAFECQESKENGQIIEFAAKKDKKKLPSKLECRVSAWVPWNIKECARCCRCGAPAPCYTSSAEPASDRQFSDMSDGYDDGEEDDDEEKEESDSEKEPDSTASNSVKFSFKCLECFEAIYCSQECLVADEAVHRFGECRAIETDGDGDGDDDESVSERPTLVDNILNLPYFWDHVDTPMRRAVDPLRGVLELASMRNDARVRLLLRLLGMACTDMDTRKVINTEGGRYLSRLSPYELAHRIGLVSSIIRQWPFHEADLDSDPVKLQIHKEVLTYDFMLKALDLIDSRSFYMMFPEIEASKREIILGTESPMGALCLSYSFIGMKHSCEPSFATSDKGSLRSENRILTASFKRQTDAPVCTVSYFDLSMPESFEGYVINDNLLKRRAAILDRWKFHCTCTKCVADEQKLFATPRSDQKVTEAEIAHWKAFQTIRGGAEPARKETIAEARARLAKNKGSQTSGIAEEAGLAPAAGKAAVGAAIEAPRKPRVKQTAAPRPISISDDDDDESSASDSQQDYPVPNLELPTGLGIGSRGDTQEESEDEEEEEKEATSGRLTGVYRLQDIEEVEDIEDPSRDYSLYKKFAASISEFMDTSGPSELRDLRGKGSSARTPERTGTTHRDGIANMFGRSRTDNLNAFGHVYNDSAADPKTMDRFLDIGCSTGAAVFQVAGTLGLNSTGIDIREDAIRLAEEYTDKVLPSDVFGSARVFCQFLKLNGIVDEALKYYALNNIYYMTTDNFDKDAVVEDVNGKLNQYKKTGTWTDGIDFHTLLAALRYRMAQGILMSSLWGDKRPRLLGTSSIIPVGDVRDRAAKRSSRTNASQVELLSPYVPGVYIQLLRKVLVPTYWNTTTPNVGGAYVIKVDLEDLRETEKKMYESLAQMHLGKKEEWLAPAPDRKSSQKTKKRK